MNVPELIFGGISLGIVFLYGSVGEIITEKAGHLNLGIPGIMCMGAAGGMFGATLYMNSLANPKSATLLPLILMTIIFAVAFGAIGGTIYAALTVSLKSNQNVVGLAITAFGAGFSEFFIKKFVVTAKLSRASKVAKDLISFEISNSIGVQTTYKFGVLA